MICPICGKEVKPVLRDYLYRKIDRNGEPLCSYECFLAWLIAEHPTTGWCGSNVYPVYSHIYAADEPIVVG